jgi:hypothetical protein
MERLFGKKSESIKLILEDSIYNTKLIIKTFFYE